MNSKQEKLERDKLVEKLSEIASGSRRSKTVRLREIFDDIEAAKASGATNKEIVAGLAEIDLIFDVNNFKNAVSRIRKERIIQALTCTNIDPEIPTTLLKHATSQSSLLSAIGTTKSKPDSKRRLTTTSSALKETQVDSLIRPAGITSAAWTEMQQKHKANLRRLKQGEIQ
jgi:predicted transcriptional regulator